MRLKPWRGNNVVLTDRSGRAILILNERGSLEEAQSMADPAARPEQDFSSLERLALSVAAWIEWTAIEVHEFHLHDIHPSIHRAVASLVPELVETPSEGEKCAAA